MLLAGPGGVGRTTSEDPPRGVQLAHERDDPFQPGRPRDAEKQEVPVRAADSTVFAETVLDVEVHAFTCFVSSRQRATRCGASKAPVEQHLAHMGDRGLVPVSPVWPHTLSRRADAIAVERKKSRSAPRSAVRALKTLPPQWRTLPCAPNPFAFARGQQDQKPPLSRGFSGWAIRGSNP